MLEKCQGHCVATAEKPLVGAVQLRYLCFVRIGPSHNNDTVVVPYGSLKEIAQATIISNIIGQRKNDRDAGVQIRSTRSKKVTKILRMCAFFRSHFQFELHQRINYGFYTFCASFSGL